MGEHRRAELCAALSVATDVATGVAPESGIRATLVAMGLCDELGVEGADRSDVYYLTLLRMAGCTATPEVSDVMGDVRALGTTLDTLGIDFGDKRQSMPVVLRHVTAGEPVHRKVRNVAKLMTMPPAAQRAIQHSHCEVAERLADRLGTSPAVRDALSYVYERWDGKGSPARVAGESIPYAVRLGTLACAVEIHHRRGGVDAAVDMARARAGKALDPLLAERFAARAKAVLEALDEPSPWRLLLDLEPAPWQTTDDAGVDEAAVVIGDFGESPPWAKGHGRRVAVLAEVAARSSGLDAGEVAAVRRAGHLHDVGRVTVPLPALNKPGPLSDLEWETVRLHAYQTERIACRSAALADAGRLAGLHHERLDGSGYHRQAAPASIPFGARLLAAADVLVALGSDRPYRPALAMEAAAERVAAMAADGLLDGAAVNAVLAAAGRRRVAATAGPAGLTERETEVLRTVARGLSIKQAARALGVSPKTVDAHLQRIYPKLGVSTRAAATLRAVELGLV